jgi:hypothetical protein
LSGELWLDGELMRKRGDISMEIGDDPSDAERWYQQAVARARQVGQKLLELRASAGLARLLSDTQRPEAARELLRQVTAELLDGSVTADVADAHDLLRKLG